LKGSPALAGLIALVHAGAASGFLLVVQGKAGMALALLFVALGIAVAWDRALLRGRRSVTGLELGREGALVLERADGRREAHRAAARRYVSRSCVAIPLADAPWRSLLLLPVMLEPAAFRQVRLWALWGRLSADGLQADSPAPQDIVRTI
jgi:hypothetical protein